jgi:hypothetical protein
VKSEVLIKCWKKQEIKIYQKLKSK